MSDPTAFSTANGVQPAAQPAVPPVQQPAYQAPPQYAPTAVTPAGPVGEDSVLVTEASTGSGAVRSNPRGLLTASSLVLIIAVAALFVAAVLLILFNSSSESVNALAVVAVAIVALSAAYFGVSLAVKQLSEERAEKAAALERMAEAETSARESDVWSAQMEAGLRVAMVKLKAAGIPSDDVIKASGAPDDFF